MVINSFFEQFTIIQIVLFALFLLAFFVQMFYYWAVFAKVAFFKKKLKQSEQLEGVSIIVCAHNDATNLKKNLPYLLKQNYPTFEIVVVLDNSVDDSDLVLETLKREYSNLEYRVISRTQDKHSNKKIDLVLAMRAAKYERLLFTEPNCCPVSQNWLSTMQSNFSDKKKIILGYTHYTHATKVVRCDLFYLALHYLGMAARGYAYMGDGKNMAYSKQLCIDKLALDSRITFQREDVVSISKMANKKNTVIDISPESFVELSYPFAKYNWLLERKRLLQSFKFPTSRNSYPALLEIISRVVFFVLLVVLSVQLPIFAIVAAILLFVRVVSMLIIFIKAQKRLNEKKMLGAMFLYDLFSPIALLYFRCTKRKDPL